MILLTSQNFDQEVLKSEIPVLVDFYADWCGPCQAMGPIIEELEPAFAEATAGKGKVKIGKVDVDKENELAGKYVVMSIPTLIAFKNGQEIGRKIGLVGKEELVKLVKLA